MQVESPYALTLADAPHELLYGHATSEEFSEKRQKPAGTC